MGKLNNGTKIIITVTYKGEIALNECIHFYNVFLRSIMKKLNLVEFGRCFYDPEKKIDVPEFK